MGQHKRFLVFRFEEDNPKGGFNDLSDSFDTFDEAKQHFNLKRNIFNEKWQIYDRIKGKVVFSV
jgi:hypothetical protein